MLQQKQRLAEDPGEEAEPKSKRIIVFSNQFLHHIVELSSSNDLVDNYVGEKDLSSCSSLIAAVNHVTAPEAVNSTHLRLPPELDM